MRFSKSYTSVIRPVIVILSSKGLQKFQKFLPKMLENVNTPKRTTRVLTTCAIKNQLDPPIESSVNKLFPSDKKDLRSRLFTWRLF